MTKSVLLSLLEEKKFKSIHEVLSQYNPVDLASLFSELNEKDLVLVFRMLEKTKAADVFAYMDNDIRQTLLSGFSDLEIQSILESMFTDDVVDFLEDMPANVVTKLLEKVDKSTRTDINKILQYADGSVGSIMTTEFVELRPQMTIKNALEKIRNVGIESETIYTCYVVEKQKLVGVISAKTMLTNPDTSVIDDLMTDNFIFAKTSDDREYTANLFRKYGLIAIPVVDGEGCIVGIVTFDDAIEVLTEETTEDIHKMAAITASDESYLKASVFTHAKNRIGWLLILMLSATITGRILANYEATFAVIPLLVSFIPMLMDTGGNCGSQSATLVIRGLAVDELHFADFFKIIWKEFRVSLLVGLVLTLANGLRIYIFYHDIRLTIVICASLLLTVIIAKLVGCSLPILAKRCGLDPAIMAAPLITTIVDTCSIMIYFKIATIILNL
ncbi:MAG: magnesium transporter [Oscillospiraceae bacterium]